MIHILVTGPRHEIHREPSLGKNPRWCFRCRKQTAFSLIVIADAEPSYYEPTAHIRCDECNQDDADLFPGSYREWGEEGWYVVRDEF